MRMLLGSAVVVLSVLFLGSVGFCDTVEFQNGDKLTGRVVRMEGGTLVFKADVAGEVTLKFSDIVTFSTDDAIDVIFEDGRKMRSPAKHGDAGFFGLTEFDEFYRLEDVEAVNPPVKPSVVWSGIVLAGLTSTHGNTFSESSNLSLDATRRTDGDRMRLFSTYHVGREKNGGGDDKVTTEENFVAGSKYDFFLSKQFYTFVNGRYKRDHIANLDHRVIGGWGCGYQWVESPSMKFSTDVGLAYMYEQYTQSDPSGDRNMDRNEDVTAQLGYNYWWKINGKLELLHEMLYYPAFSGLSDYYLTTQAELRVSLTESLFSSMKVVLDYDSTPADTSGTTDTKYILGMGMKF